MKKLIIATCLFLLPISSFAGFKFNPKVNYNLLEYNNNDATGVGFGLGLGYSFIGLYTVLEYETAELSLDGSSSDQTMKNMGLVLGYEFPILLNVWINYVFDAEIGSDEGSGTKLGLGYSVAPMVQLYLEIFNLEYDKSNGSTLSSKRELSGQQIGIQIPF
ncbi:MAG: hypothetical protein VX642_06445 [Bdellovibrionota bacterium]|nr:hypothetical protein [Bdellovibrionota bacterium]